MYIVQCTYIIASRDWGHRNSLESSVHFNNFSTFTSWCLTLQFSYQFTLNHFTSRLVLYLLAAILFLGCFSQFSIILLFQSLYMCVIMELCWDENITVIETHRKKTAYISTGWSCFGIKVIRKILLFSRVLNFSVEINYCFIWYFLNFLEN